MGIRSAVRACSARPGGPARRRAGRRRATRVRASLLLTLSILGTSAAGGLALTPARAAAGSLIGGLVWADADRDGTRDAGESTKQGVTVELLSLPSRTVARTTVSLNNGTWGFSDVPDGSYLVRVTAPGPFTFPETAQAQNVLRLEGAADPGQPQRGVSAPFAVSGATQLTTLGAGLQPWADLDVDRLQIPAACAGYAATGTPPFDAADGPGKDAGTANCVVRTGDSVRQNYSVALTGLPSGVEVPNVVLELTVSPVSDPGDPSDAADAALRLAGPGAGGLPAGCLSTANGANPGSSATTNADGSITVVCNLGPMSSNVATVSLLYSFSHDTPVPGFASVTAHAYAGQDDAGPSNTVAGPVVEVTAVPQWQLKKFLHVAPTATTHVVNGVSTPGFFVDYRFRFEDLTQGTGGAALVWPVSFTDRMTKFPHARILSCRRATQALDGSALGGDNWWELTCPLGEVAGTDGWSLAIAPNAASRDRAAEMGFGNMIMRVFVPTDDAYAAMVPGWEYGDPLPAGELDWRNLAEDTDGWTMLGGRLNDGDGDGTADGFEPGWDGVTASGDNVVAHENDITTPTVSVQKGYEAGSFGYTTRTINGVPTAGYVMTYRFYITVGDRSFLVRWPDTTALKDVMPDHPGAYLVGCNSQISSGSVYNRGSVQCPDINQRQPADGWDFSYVPNGNGLNQGLGSWLATFFIPVDTITADRCAVSPTASFTVRNELRLAGEWTIHGAPINGTGTEPGWDGTTASGNNVDERPFNISAGGCGGTLTGTKNYYVLAGGNVGLGFTSPGDAVGSYVQAVASNAFVTATDLTVCDVFDVSVYRVFGDPLAATPQDHDPRLVTPLDPDDFVIEYAVGANGVDTQTGPKAGGVYPIDSGANTTDVQSCRDEPGRTWTTDPAQTFGADWRDEVNMVRARPVEPGLVSRGPFTHQLRVALQVRSTYNGGPDAGRPIPAGVQLNNTGGWSQGTGGDAWGTVTRRITNTIPISGRKVYESWTGGQVIDNSTVSAGTKVWSDVDIQVQGGHAPGPGDEPGFPMRDLTLCDVFDRSVLRITGPATTARTTGDIDRTDYVIEYAVGPNDVDTQAGPPSGGLYPVNRSSLVTAVGGCRDDTGVAWATDPAAAFGAGWQDRVNMVRVRPIDPEHVETGTFRFWLQVPLEVRSTYNGGPDAGDPIPTGVRLSNTGGWPTDTDRGTWTTTQAELRYAGMSLTVGKTRSQASYLPGQTAVWNLTVGITNGVVGGTMRDLRLVDRLPEGLDYDPACTEAALPAGVTASYQPVNREVTFRLGDIPVTSIVQPVYTAASPLRLCTTVQALAQPGDTYVNTVQALADNSENAPTANATISATGSGQLGLIKSVDKPYVASGETYRWSLEWGNTSTEIAFRPTDIIDVLPWNGDGEAGSGSQRTQYASDFTGLARLAGPLTAPTYVRGATGPVPGTWYYTTADPATLRHDPRAAANDAPEAPGGLWRTVAEVADLADVTAVRFVSDEWLGTTTRVRAVIAAVSTSDDLDNLYVNRAMIYSATFPNQPLLSNEPYVQMPGFSLGDLVWVDQDFDGRFGDGDTTPVGVPIEVLGEDGEVVATATTGATGRWQVDGLPAGTYRARIPAWLFRPGQPLAQAAAVTVRNSAAAGENENLSNNDVPGADLAVTGLVSSPITLAYRYSTGADPRLIGANGPTDDDVARLAPPLIGAEFTDYTLDLALAPVPAVDIVKWTNGEDANVPTGPQVTVGETVTWTYRVTNTGSASLYDVTVTDDQIADDEADIDCGGTGSNVVAGPLEVGGSVDCVATGIAVPGQYANVGTVDARAHDTVDEDGDRVPGTAVTDSDPSHYFGVVPSADIDLPHTGGSGDRNFVLGGGGLIVVALLLTLHGLRARGRRTDDAPPPAHDPVAD